MGCGSSAPIEIHTTTPGVIPSKNYQNGKLAEENLETDFYKQKTDFGHNVSAGTPPTGVIQSASPQHGQLADEERSETVDGTVCTVADSEGVQLEQMYKKVEPSQVRVHPHFTEFPTHVLLEKANQVYAEQNPGKLYQYTIST